ncbi:MAG: topoisomerase DNA-binding C4 zinc finger domain-containing protein [Burkholderiaceae bacterium]|nr:topoisomerase DNA-binding C4 zinc finger domain-containing protein [Burkholderiaceae bacterium]
MTDRIFEKFADASGFARQMAQDTGRAVRVVRVGDHFCVSAPESAPPANPSAVTAITDRPIHEIVEAIRENLTENPNEHEVLEWVQQGLDSLRGLYPHKRDSFSPGDIAFLQTLPEYSVTLQEFFDALDDAKSVRTKDDAIEVASTFANLAERLNATKLADRARKESRELVERIPKLPGRSATEEEARKRHQESLVSAHAPPCGKCGARMALRGGSNWYFWSCSRFPDCSSTRWLSKFEAARLADQSQTD